MPNIEGASDSMRVLVRLDRQDPFASSLGKYGRMSSTNPPEALCRLDGVPQTLCLSSASSAARYLATVHGIAVPLWPALVEEGRPNQVPNGRSGHTIHPEWNAFVLSDRQ